MLKRRFSYRYFQTLIMVSAHHKGYRIEQIETLFEDRKLGKSFLSAVPVGVIAADAARPRQGLRRVPPHVGTNRRPRRLPRPAPARHGRPDPLALPRRALSPPLRPPHAAASLGRVAAGAALLLPVAADTSGCARSDIRELQELRLRALIKYAYRHVPYYREALDRLGIKPDEIQHVEDLQRLPVLTKDDIRRNLYFDLMSDAHDKGQMLPITTSGSTGEPLTLYADKTQLEMRWATTLRNIDWTRLSLRGPTGPPVALDPRHVAPAGVQGTPRCVAHAAQVLLRLRDERGERSVATSSFCAAERPTLIDGYAEAFNLIANYLKQQPRRWHPAKGNHLVGADAVGGDARGHRAGLERQGVRQVRQSRIQRYRPRVRGAPRTSCQRRVVHRRDRARRQSGAAR